MSILSNEDKIAIINQHKRNVEYSKYNLEISVILENAVVNPNKETIDSLNEKISDLDKKILVLDAELASL